MASTAEAVIEGTADQLYAKKDAADAAAISYYFTWFVMGTLIGTMVGFGIACTEGEYLPYEPSADPSDVDVGTQHYPISDTVYYLTPTGSKWTGGGAGVGAALGLILSYLCRNVDLGSVKKQFLTLFGAKVSADTSANLISASPLNK